MEEMGAKGLEFFSATYRLWNMQEHLDPHYEDHVQAIVYKETLLWYPSKWLLGKHHYFEAGKVKTFCFDTHYGILMDVEPAFCMIQVLMRMEKRKEDSENIIIFWIFAI